MSHFVSDIPANVVAELTAVRKEHADCQTRYQELHAKFNDALRKLGVARASWDLGGQSVVSPSQLAAIESKRAATENEVETLRSELRIVNSARRRIMDSWRWKICGELQGNGITWWAAALLPAAVCAALAAVISLAAGCRAVATLANILLTFLAAYVIASFHLLFPSDEELLAKMSRIENRRQELLTALRPAVDRLAIMATEAAQTKELFDVYHEFMQSQADVRRYEGEMMSTLDRIARLKPALENLEELYGKRSQLFQSNWRELRDVAFETFLCEVFQELGFTVETTPVTGDQGVDVIAARNGKRLAIQAKGYPSSRTVGNDAVQQVYAGKAFYRCDSHAVITNSKFTSSARTLATSLGCLLIDQDTMESLVFGQISLE